MFIHYYVYTYICKNPFVHLSTASVSAKFVDTDAWGGVFPRDVSLPERFHPAICLSAGAPQAKKKKKGMTQKATAGEPD